MSDSERKVLEQALAAMRFALPMAEDEWNYAPIAGQGVQAINLLRAAIAAAESALAAPAAEPVAWMVIDVDGKDCYVTSDPTLATKAQRALPLYTDPVVSERPCTCHPSDKPPVPCPKKYALSECRKAALAAPAAEPVARKPLTDEEIDKIREEYDNPLLFARAVERAHHIE